MKTDVKICFLGDSITEGVGASSYDNCYVARVAASYPQATVRNFGVSATRIAKQKVPSADAKHDEDFLTRAQKMDKNADFVFVFGGTNDYGHGDADIGEEGNKDCYTFVGAFQSLIEYLAAVYGKKKLCFILPLYRWDEDNPLGDGSKTTAGCPLSVYREIERKLLVEYGVDFLDLAQSFPPPTLPDGDELTVDGLHPNDKGHAVIAENIIAYLKDKYFCNRP